MSEWQPIETAPKDSNTFAVLDARSGYMGYRRFGEFDEFSGKFGEAGWFDIDYTYGDDDLSGFTHWLPLPSPPTTDSGEKND